MQAWSSNSLSGSTDIKGLAPLRSFIRMLNSVGLNKNKELKRKLEIQRRDNKKVVYK